VRISTYPPRLDWPEGKAHPILANFTDEYGEGMIINEPIVTLLHSIGVNGHHKTFAGNQNKTQ